MNIYVLVAIVVGIATLGVKVMRSSEAKAMPTADEALDHCADGG